VNGCKDFLRKKKVRGFILLCTGRRENEEGVEVTVDAVDAGRGATEAMLDKEMGEQIRQALDRLPFQQRAAFTLRYLDGLSIEEVADSMTLTEGAVKAHLWQGGQKMKVYLKKYVMAEEGAQ